MSVKFCFGDIVVVENNLIGVVVKTWVRSTAKIKNKMVYEVYVRNYNEIKEYEEYEMERYLVRHKELDETEMEYQNNAIHALEPFYGAPEDMIKIIQDLVKEVNS